MAHDHEGAAELATLRAELATVEQEYGFKVTSIFPGTDSNATKADVLRELILSVRRIGEELKHGTLEEIPLED